MKYIAMVLLLSSINIARAEGSGLPFTMNSVSSASLAPLSLFSLFKESLYQHKDTFITVTVAMMLAKWIMFKKDRERQAKGDLFSFSGTVISLAMLFDEWKNGE